MPLLASTRKAARLGAAFLLVLGGLVACAGHDAFGGSRRAVIEWSMAHGFIEAAPAEAAFQLLTLVRGSDGEAATVYIEGDGAAWASAYHPPSDPTPDRPTALAMAAADSAARVIYLGRPCQYLDGKALVTCAPRYWTTHRFAPEVIKAYGQVLDELKARHGLRHLRLVGYSGGGVIAALLANRREDVAGLVTVAAPLALKNWAAGHGVSPLRASLDPLTDTFHRQYPATHLAGEEDKVTPPEVLAAYAAQRGGHLRRVPGFDHHCCWSRDWKRLLGGSR